MPRNKTAHQPALGEGFAFSMVRVGKQVIRVGQRAVAMRFDLAVVDASHIAHEVV